MIPLDPQHYPSLLPHRPLNSPAPVGSRTQEQALASVRAKRGPGLGSARAVLVRLERELVQGPGMWELASVRAKWGLAWWVARSEPG